MTHIATKNAVVSAFRFLAKAGPGLWLSLLLPAVAGGILFYGSMNLYLLNLEHYLIQPTDRIGSTQFSQGRMPFQGHLYPDGKSFSVTEVAAIGR